jgi:hypothetical protein
MSTVKATNFQNASSATANMVTDASGNVSFGGTAAMSTSFLRNRIINGDMRVDQRNAGAAVTVNTALDFFPVDRFACSGQVTDGVFTAQQSSTAPAGFTKSVVCTVTTADASIGATQRYFIEQKIEGYNVADFGFGAAGASTVTLSFWVRSSLTGTFGGAVYGGQNYPFSYTINAANTWEQKTVTIAGSTSGTWNTTTSTGLSINFSLGTGSTYKGTANAWTSSTILSVTGAVDLISTSGATFYVTGVQLEVGTVATPFERQLYSNQFAQCQRYYYSLGGGTFEQFGTGATTGTTGGSLPFQFPVVMRSAPTFSISAAGDFQITDGGGNTTVTGLTADLLTQRNARLNPSGVAWTATQRPLILQSQSGTSARLTFSAEL